MCRKNGWRSASPHRNVHSLGKGKQMNIIESLHGVWANDYHFGNIIDLATAALVRTVLADRDQTSRRNLLERIVSPEMRIYSGRTVETEHLPPNTWNGVDRNLIAELINEGKNIDTSGWTEASHNKAYKKTVKFIKYDFLPKIDGVEYVKQMPDELARFLIDCWLAA